MKIYALKVHDTEWTNEIHDKWTKEILDSLRSGEGRFGWSYVKTADLRELRHRVEESGWDNLNDDEQKCYYGQEFLLDLEPGDYVVFLNVPQYGRCMLAKVTSEYFFRWESGDFNHRFSVDPDSVYEFDRNDAMVAPALSARLKLQGKKWRIYAESEFNELLKSLCQEVIPRPSTSEDNLLWLKKEIKEEIGESLKSITKKIQETHPNKDLEKLVEQVFRRVPGVRSVVQQRGRADHGADLVVELEVGTIPELVQTLLIQVKSWEGTHDSDSAIEDIRRAFDAYEHASMGLIVSTANEASDDFRSKLDKLAEESRKPVSLLIGEDLAAFILRHAPDLLLR